jgi:NADH:ubiquinone oxidoreductase subunit 6 (subunit J)
MNEMQFNEVAKTAFNFFRAVALVFAMATVLSKNPVQTARFSVVAGVAIIGCGIIQNSALPIIMGALSIFLFANSKGEKK